MIQPRVITGFDPDERVVYVATPSLDMKGYWIGIMIGTVIGLMLFILPGIIVLVVGLFSGFTARSTLRERYRDAECVVTSKRIIVTGWGRSRRLIEFEHHQIARIASSSWLARLLAGKSVTIRGVDGRRVKLDRLADAGELVEVAREAMAASGPGQP